MSRITIRNESRSIVKVTTRAESKFEAIIGPNQEWGTNQFAGSSFIIQRGTEPTTYEIEFPANSEINATVTEGGIAGAAYTVHPHPSWDDKPSEPTSDDEDITADDVEAAIGCIQKIIKFIKKVISAIKAIFRRG